jgi:hypothetical protein
MRPPYLGALHSNAPLLRDEQAMWTAKVRGEAVKCTACGGSGVALGIEGPRAYQWHCMRCGAKSSFFLVTKGTVRVHIRDIEGETLRHLEREES